MEVLFKVNGSQQENEGSLFFFIFFLLKLSVFFIIFTLFRLALNVFLL